MKILRELFDQNPKRVVRTLSVIVPLGEPTGPILEHLIESLLRTDSKLRELYVVQDVA